MYLEDLANWIDTQDFDFVYWNMLHEAYYLSISTMPEQAKTTAVQRLQASNVSELHKAEFARIIDFIKKGVSLDGGILLMKIADLDKKRDTDLNNHHKELAQSIGYPESGWRGYYGG
jgi:hypothetical protein